LGTFVVTLGATVVGATVVGATVVGATVVTDPEPAPLEEPELLLLLDPHAASPITATRPTLSPATSRLVRAARTTMSAPPCDPAPT